MIDKRFYRLGPLTLQLVTSAQAQQQRVVATWRHLFRIEPVTLGAATSTLLGVHLLTTPLPEPSPLSPAMPGAGPIAIGTTATGLCCSCGATRFQIDAVQPHAIGYVAADFWDLALVVQRSFWQTLFFLLVRRTGCTFLHANALYPAAQGSAAGVLLVGDCGSGKTSLTLSLMAAGWHYVTDDTVLLQRTDPVDPTSAQPVHAMQAHAVRRGFACTQETLARWPWLAALAAQGTALNRQKVLLDPDPLYPASFAPICAPRLLCFPQIRHTAQSQIHPLTPTQSFRALLTQPRNGLIAEPAFTPALLAHFHALVEQCASYELALGWDVFHEPAQLSALLLACLSTSAPEAIAA